MEKYWLMKSEPDVWSIDQQKKAGARGVAWDGVRNYQAANNLKKMKKGDLCFFYHSNIGKEIVGIVEVIKEAFLAFLVFLVLFFRLLLPTFSPVVNLYDLTHLTNYFPAFIVYWHHR